MNAEYKTKAVQGLARLWNSEGLAAVEESIERMPTPQRLIFRSLIQVIDIEALLQKLDENPEAMAKIRKVLLRILGIIEEDLTVLLGFESTAGRTGSKEVEEGEPLIIEPYEQGDRGTGFYNEDWWG